MEEVAVGSSNEACDACGYPEEHETMASLAAKINECLAAGGMVQVSTYLRSVIYKKRHAGWFTVQKGSLYVRRGRGKDCLSFGDNLGVSIRLSRGDER